jgi:hypothetical protein
VEAGGHLSEEEHRLYDYYGMDWDASWARANRPGEGGWAHQGAAGAGAAAGERRGRTGGAMTGGADAMAGGTDRDATGRAGTDDAMTRSEERMHVGVERREAGRARLRTYVVTEQEERTVPVRHEEVRVEREPITDANRDDALSGPDISEAEADGARRGPRGARRGRGRAGRRPRRPALRAVVRPAGKGAVGAPPTAPPPWSEASAEQSGTTFERPSGRRGDALSGKFVKFFTRNLAPEGRQAPSVAPFGGSTGL